MEKPDIFRTNVRLAMDAKGVSITELARRIGTDRANMSRILSGSEAVTIQRADRIANALDEKLEELLVEKVLQQA